MGVAHVEEPFIDCLVACAREGWREPVDFEVERKVFFELLASNKLEARPRVGAKFHVLEHSRAASFVAPGPEDRRIGVREVFLDADTVDHGVRLAGPLGFSTIRMKSKDRDQVRAEILERAR